MSIYLNVSHAICARGLILLICYYKVNDDTATHIHRMLQMNTVFWGPGNCIQPGGWDGCSTNNDYINKHEFLVAYCIYNSMMRWFYALAYSKLCTSDNFFFKHKSKVWLRTVFMTTKNAILFTHWKLTTVHFSVQVHPGICTVTMWRLVLNEGIFLYLLMF